MRVNLATVAVSAAVAALVAAASAGAAATILVSKPSQLKNGVVTGPKIKKGAVRSTQVADGSLAAKDLTKAARATLKGNVGPKGDKGDAGPAAVPVAFRYAPDGANIAGGGADAEIYLGTETVPAGQYHVTWSATLLHNDNTSGTWRFTCALTMVAAAQTVGVHTASANLIEDVAAPRGVALVGGTSATSFTQDAAPRIVCSSDSAVVPPLQRLFVRVILVPIASVTDRA